MRSIKIGDSTVLVSDGRNTGKPNFQGFSLTIYAKDGAEADKLFGALGEGGEVRMPMDKTFFSHDASACSPTNLASAG